MWCVFLFLLTRNISRGYLGFEQWNILKIPQSWYANLFTAYLGMPEASFFSTDYFSIFPWIFLFLAGYFLYHIFSEKDFLKYLETGKIALIEWFGRHSFEIYLVHQPVIYFILSLFFIMSDQEKVKNTVKKCFTKSFLEKASDVGGQLKIYLGGYIKAQLVIMSIAFVVIFVGLSISRVEYAMLIALGIAALDALPLFGSGIVLIPWSIISLLSRDFKMGVGLLIIYLAIVLTRQMLESKIVSHNLGTNPLLTLMSMYIGYKIFSIGGMILGPIILVLVISFHKAGALEAPERVARNIIKKTKDEIIKIYRFILK